MYKQQHQKLKRATSFIQVLLLMAYFFILSSKSVAQVPTCGLNVPFYQVNLSGHPDSIWYSPGHSRNGNCCGTTSPDRCTSFEIILDTGAAMVNFNIASGAIPPGSMFYQIGCGPQVAVGQPICIVGAGPHHLTFCKPGNNQNTYFVQSIPKPTFPKPQHVRIGCSQVIKVLGLDTPSVTWTSVYPGTTGQYNSYLSCTNGCVSPLYTPATNAPAYVDYKICGTPIATSCGYVALCDTVRIYNESVLTGTVTPDPAGFCASGSGVLLTANASGGYGAYTFIWRDQSNNIVGTGATYNATGAGIFSVEIRDALYNSSSCPSTFISVPVTVTNVPVVNAGVDQTLCASNPTAYLSGSILYATGGVWSGGAGTFNPGNTNLNASYTPTAAEILSGVVTLTLSSTGAGGGCPNITDVVILNYPPLLGVTLSNTNVSCHNSTASLSPVVSGGTPPYNYLWNNSSTSSSITAGQGNYCVSITDNIGCQVSTCANVTAPAALSLSLSSTIISVNGGSDGTATATAGGGTGAYIYNWSPGGQTTQTATGLSFGIYTVTVTDANGCSIYASVVVNEPRCASFNATSSKTNVLCYGNLSGSATVTPSGGTSPYTYSWNDPSHQTTATATGLGAGSYIVVITDQNGCLFSSNITITEPTKLTNVMNQTNVTAIGGNNGSATSNPAGGSPAYNYSWDNGAATQTISSLVAGTYILDLSDNNNCHLIDSVQITQPPCQNLIISGSSTNVSCTGGNDGSATVVALHGNAPYSYSWSNGAATATVNNLVAGTYVVTVSDALNCISFKNITITEPSPLSVALSPTPISCYGKNDGTIELTVSGGNFPYAFNWSNGITVEDLINLSNGTYSVNVTDSKGCTANGSASIALPQELKLSDTYTNVTCNSGTNGAIDLIATGGVLPYTYAWSNGSASQNLSGLSSGQYTVLVTDANGCKATIPLGILIDQPDALAVLSNSVSCPAPGSGVALVTVVPTGGWLSSYQVSFDNGTTYQTSGDYDALLPVNSTYTVIIKDNNNCLSPVPVTIPVNPELSVSSTTFDKCFYGSTANGSVTVTPSGGTGGPYSVSLDGGSTYATAGTYTFSIPVNSTYSVVIQDGNLCVSLPATVSLPAVMTSTSTASSFNNYNVSCYGLTDASITLSTTGGTQPYSYAWSNSTTTQNQTGIAAGNYSVVISDVNNCSDTLHFTITQPAALTSTITATSDYNGYNISCFGLTDGSLNLAVSGGVTTYSYSWNTGSSSQNLSSISAGTYSVLVTDANNCSTTSQITLTQPSDLVSTLVSLSNYNGYNVSCFGSANGSIDINVTGGVTAYSYAWSNNTTTQDQANIAAGTYSVVIADANNCKDTLNFTLTQPAVLTSSVTGTSDYNGYDISCFGLLNGSVDISVSGGVTSYSYAWSNNTITQDQTNIGAGTYSVVITDANNCKDTLNLTLTQPAQLNSTGAVASNFNGYSVSCYGSVNGIINTNTTGGVPVYTYAWSNSASSQNLNGIGAGSYSVVVTDQNSCTDTLQFTLTQPDSISATSVIQNVLCNSFHNGSIDVTVAGGVIPYTYSWSDNSTNQDLSNIGLGTYTVVITDLNGCTSTRVYGVTEASPIVINLSHTDVSCYNQQNGSVTSVVSGGTPTYTYLWSNGATQSQLSNLAPGNYVLTVSDANSCTHKDSVLVTQPNSLSATLSSPTLDNGHNVSFYHSADGSVNTTVSGGTTPYVYSWSNGSTSQNLSNVAAGTYTLLVTDKNGCTFVADITLTQPAELAMPTGISPNGDGLNDYFVVRGLEAYPNNNITIFNRWGNSVYEKDKYANMWAGKSNAGADLPDGTYFVILKINNGDITLTGYVDVRR
ncbi:MAG: T9SS type B sorting domain-containing protein [Bacteroidia bacterium]